MILLAEKEVKAGLVASLSLLLGACAGSGSFDALEVNPNPPQPEKPPIIDNVPEPRQNKEEQGKLQQPALGFALKGVRRNYAGYDSKGNQLLDDKGNPREAEPHLSLKPDDLKIIDGAGLGDNPLLEEMQKDPDNEGSRISHNAERQHQNKSYDYIRFGYVESSGSKLENQVYRGSDGNSKPFVSRQGRHVYTFYYGVNPSMSLPAAGEAKYSGEWYFMTDAKQNREMQDANRYYGHDGDHSSATRYGRTDTDASYKAEFSVDFGKKKLGGQLGYGSRYAPFRQIYDLQADIKGNRFNGKAKSLVNKESQEFERNLFHAHSDFLEGGFYGPSAEELAGKFLSNDNSAFIVFGAKRQNSGSSESHKNTLFDAYHIARPKIQDVIKEPDEEDEEDFDDNEEDFEDDEQQDDTVEPKPQVIGRAIGEIQTDQSANFGDIMKFRLGGNVFDLENKTLSPELKKTFPDAVVITDDKKRTLTIVLSKDDKGTFNEYIEACCTNLNYMRFGSFRLKDKPDREAVSALYVQGERTAETDMPVSGTATYAGTWAGFIWAGKPDIESYTGMNTLRNAGINADMGGNSKSRAEFDVDFGNKKLTGSLKGENSSAIFKIDAGITGSSFKGRAYTDGHFDFDPKSTGRHYKISVDNAEVNGGFYGNGAAELGGRVFYNGKGNGHDQETIKIGAVFGAKKEVQQPKP